MTRLKVGLLGAGYIVQAHARALAEIDAVEMRAVCDVSEARAAQAAAEFGIPQVCTSLEQLLGGVKLARPRQCVAVQGLCRAGGGQRRRTALE